MKKGLFITNRYYSDKGTEHAFASLCAAFLKKGVSLERVSPLACFDKNAFVSGLFGAQFAVFWDKDCALAAALERTGMRVFNSSKTLEVCDDKLKTYACLKDIDIPLTIPAPLCYDVNTPTDTEFLQFVTSTLKLPLVVKANTGSQGRQVFLAQTFEEVSALYQELRHTKHHYQRVTGEYGKDLRVYVVGGKAVASCIRTGTDFRSNLASGGGIELFTASADYIEAAESIASQLSLDFGAVDFLISDSPIFLEVNSNAYFTGIEKLGVSIGESIAGYIYCKVFGGSCD